MKVINKLNDGYNYVYVYGKDEVNVYDSDDSFIACFPTFNKVKNYTWAFQGYHGVYELEELVEETVYLITYPNSTAYAHNLDVTDDNTYSVDKIEKVVRGNFPVYIKAKVKL